MLEVNWMGRLSTITHLLHDKVILNRCLQLFLLNFRVNDLLEWNFLAACSPSIIDYSEPLLRDEPLLISRRFLLVSKVHVVDRIRVRVKLLLFLKLEHFLQSALVLVITHV
jgi:hypothetical protein